jgi:2-amino-4-hydroxy-6-hydroxymethyldihydropteridine diphosphokinase
VGLGSNQGNPRAQVRGAFGELAGLPHTRVLAMSPLYASAPVGLLEQPGFVNACALLETALTPRELLDGLLEIERRHGRVRDVPNGPRTLDLDIVLYGDVSMHEHGLTLPHPRAHERAFVLAPLLDVWPDAIIPGRGAASALRERTRDQEIEKLAPS